MCKWNSLESHLQDTFNTTLLVFTGRQNTFRRGAHCWLYDLTLMLFVTRKRQEERKEEGEKEKEVKEGNEEGRGRGQGKDMKDKVLKEQTEKKEREKDEEKKGKK